jgi:hypothetical protein
MPWLGFELISGANGLLSLVTRGRSGFRSISKWWAGNCIDLARSFMQLPAPKNDKWIVRICFKRSGGPVTARLDFSYFPGGVGHSDWTKPKSLVLTSIPAFVKGQDVAIDIMERDDSQATPIWHWSTAERRVILITMHRCRLVLLAGDKEIGDFSFIAVKRKEKCPNLLLIGENQFAYSAKWRRAS